MNSFKRVRAFQIEWEFESRGKTGVRGEKPLGAREREPIKNSIHIWLQRRDLNPGHIGGRRVL